MNCYPNSELRPTPRAPSTQEEQQPRRTKEEHQEQAQTRYCGFSRSDNRTSKYWNNSVTKYAYNVLCVWGLAAEKCVIRKLMLSQFFFDITIKLDVGSPRKSYCMLAILSLEVSNISATNSKSDKWHSHSRSLVLKQWQVRRSDRELHGKAVLNYNYELSRRYPLIPVNVVYTYVYVTAMVATQGRHA